MSSFDQLKYYSRYFVSFIKNSSRPPIIIASIGRAGSKLLYKSILISLAQQNFLNFPNYIGQKFSGAGMWFPNKKLFRGMVHKTHLQSSYLPQNSDAKVIFLFCKPSDSVLSVISRRRNRDGDDWIKKHFKNLEANGSYDQICSFDVLRIEEQIEGWINNTSVERMILRYEKIWQYQTEIEKFIHLKIDLPIQNKSRRNLSKEALIKANKCRDFYSTLDKKVSELPDMQLLR